MGEEADVDCVPTPSQAVCAMPSQARLEILQRSPIEAGLYPLIFFPGQA